MYSSLPGWIGDLGRRGLHSRVLAVVLVSLAFGHLFFFVWLFCFCCLVILCSSCGTSVVFLWLLTWFCGSCYVAPVGLHASSVFLCLLGVPSAALSVAGLLLGSLSRPFCPVLVWFWVGSRLALRCLFFGSCSAMAWPFVWQVCWPSVGSVGLYLTKG